MKPTICLDFDGVLNNYKGYAGDNIGTPREGCKEFLETLSKDYSIVIYSVRKFTDILIWLNKHDLLQYITDVTGYKIPAVCYVDDRGLNFQGDYDETIKQIQNFKTYWEE